LGPLKRQYPVDLFLPRKPKFTQTSNSSLTGFVVETCKQATQLI